MIKASDLAIIIGAILLSFMVVIGVKSKSVSVMAQSKIKYENVMDNAVDDAFITTVEGIDSKNNVIVNKEQVAQNFLNSLCNGLGVLGNDDKEQLVKAYVPVMALVDYNGFYICSMDEYESQPDYYVTEHIWKSKKFYSYSTASYIYTFTLSDFVTIYDPVRKKTYEGTYQDIMDTYNLSDPGVLDSADTFDKVRRNRIVTLITDNLKYYINKHNQIAKEFGINYYFTLPEIDQNTWYRTIDDISFLAFFQGMPVSSTGYIFNRFSISGARILKNDYYYVDEYSTGPIKYYHSDKNCSKVVGNPLTFDSKKSAAKSGAFPCPDCH